MSEQRCVCVIDTISVFVLSVRARTSVFVWHLYIFCRRRLVGIRSYIFCGCLPFCDFLRSSSLSKLLGCQSANHCHICWPSSARFVRTMDITHHRFGICICIFGLSTVRCVRIIDITRHCFWEFEPQAQFQQWKCASQYLYWWFVVSWCCIHLCSFWHCWCPPRITSSALSLLLSCCRALR